MTRSKTKELDQVLQRSVDASSSSVDPTSSDWSRRGLGGDEAQIGYAETPSRVAQDDVNAMLTTFDGGLARKEGLTSSENIELSKELSLQPESDHANDASADSQVPHDFFSSSPEKISTASPEKPSQLMMESPSVRSGGDAQLHSSKLSIPEVVIDTITPFKGQTKVVEEMEELTFEPGTRKRKSEAGSSSRPKSVASTGASVVESEVSIPSERPKRNAAKKPMYTVEWNKDGTEKKKKGGTSEKAGKGKTPSRSSSAASKKGKQQDVITLSSDEEGAVSDEDRASPIRQKATGGKRTKAASLSPDQDDTPDANTSVQTGDGTTLVDEDTIDKNLEDDEDAALKKPRRRRGSTKKESNTIDSEDDNDDEDAPLKKPRRGGGSTRTGSNTVVPDGEGDAEDSEEDVVKTRKRARPSSSGSKAKGRKRGKQIRDDVDDDEEANANISSAKADTTTNDDEDEDADETAEEEEEEEEEEEIKKTKKGKSTVLKDASASVNAKSNSKGKETKTAKRKREEEEEEEESRSTSTAATNSTGSTSSTTKINKHFAGKPLKTILKGFTRARAPGLIKRAIAPLLTIRSAPPAKREAIPVPRSKKTKKEPVLDSDEEREIQKQRANETPEQRMARFIREHEEESD